MKQWREEEMFECHEEENSAKIPKLFFESPQIKTALPLFLSSDYSLTNKTNFPTFPGFEGGYWFSIKQWEELEVQSLIYKHILVGAKVPQQLLHLLISSSPSSYFNLDLHRFQPLVEAGYWGKGGMDAEPGRCRRTDGKKWRCSRDVVFAHKYCDRHVHRGKKRSRKPVEFPPSSASGSGVSLANSSATSAFPGGGGGRFSLSGSGASFDAFQLNQGSSELLISDKKAPSGSSSKVLMHFIDDSKGETDGNPSSSNLSIGNPTSDFLRLSTANRMALASMGMGGPLAEALRSSTHLSPTSVLH